MQIQIPNGKLSFSEQPIYKKPLQQASLGKSQEERKESIVNQVKKIKRKLINRHKVSKQKLYALYHLIIN